MYHLATYTSDDGMPKAVLTHVTGRKVAERSGPIATGSQMIWALDHVQEDADCIMVGWSDPYKSTDGTITVWNLRPQG